METLIDGTQKVAVFLARAEITAKRLDIEREHARSERVLKETKLKEVEVERLKLELKGKENMHE